MANILEVKGYTSEQIKALMNVEDKYKIGMRLYAVYQVSKGHSSRKLEDFYQTSFKQITNWVHRFEKDGVDGLRDKQGRGRKSRLSGEQFCILETMLTESPIDYGYNTATWSGAILMDWIKINFGIEYKKTQIYHILKKLGFSYQRAKGVYPEADKEKQEIFRNDLKKKVAGKS